MTLKIAWLDINIKFKNDVKLNGVNVDGYFSPREQEIIIDNELPRHIKIKCLDFYVMWGKIIVYKLHKRS